jgi:cyclopropane fatty-acyl-phospholipid synthase-like methyltransferase
VDLRAILAFPSVYRLFNRLLATKFRTVYVREYVCPKQGDHVLDVGCGMGDILEYLPDVHYCGIDMSEDYIRAARSRYGDRGQFICKPLRDVVLDTPAYYDRVMANGLVHHLDDAEVLDLFRLIRKVLKPEGKLVTHDGCFVSGQARLARYLLRRDRGHHVRDEEGYTKLATQVFPQVRVTIRHDLLRLPYTHIILECSGQVPAGAGG